MFCSISSAQWASTIASARMSRQPVSPECSLVFSALQAERHPVEYDMQTNTYKQDSMITVPSSAIPSRMHRLHAGPVQCLFSCINLVKIYCLFNQNEALFLTFRSSSIVRLAGSVRGRNTFEACSG